jgi:hypothetical protein
MPEQQSSVDRRVTGLWVYQALGTRPDPEAVVTRAHRYGLRWITVQAIKSGEVLDRGWLRSMRRATTSHGMRLGVHGRLGQPTGVGRPKPKPADEARAMAQAIDIAHADFAIINAEAEYERSTNPDSKSFIDVYRDRKPDLLSYFSSFGRPDLHQALDWTAWAAGDFRGMPQAYENLNPTELKPTRCVKEWARFFDREGIRPTLGCFKEHGKPHLPIERLVQSVRDVPNLYFNIWHYGTVTNAELKALSKIS